MSCSCSHLHGLTHIFWMPVLKLNWMCTKCSQCAHLYACAYTCVLSRACMCMHFNMFLCDMSYGYVNSPYPCENKLCVRVICDMPCGYIYAMCHAVICHVPCARASRAWADETKVFQPYSKPESTKIHLLLCASTLFNLFYKEKTYGMFSWYSCVALSVWHRVWSIWQRWY